MEAIVISGFPAAGKTTVAQLIAKKLKIESTGGGDILREMAIDRGYTVTGQDWWDTKEGIKFVKEREGNQDFDKEADRRLAEKIKNGNVVITSYTAPWIIDGGYKVWLTCRIENRAKRMSARDSIEIQKSMNIIRTRDEENSKLYKRLYGIEFGKDLKPFHLMVDTDDKTPEEIANIIINNAKENSEKVFE